LGGLNETKLGTAIDRFYEAATHPDLWRTVLHETSIALGAEGTILLSFPDPSLGMIWSQGADELIRAFTQGQWENTRAARGLPKGQWELHSEASLFQPDELDRLPFYADYLRPLGFRWFTGTTLAKAGDTSILISVERRARDEPFSSRELSSFSRALPHLRQAAKLALHLGLTRAEGTLDGLDLLSCGGVLLDWLGRTIRLNREAERHVGYGLAVVHNHVQASHRDANAALQTLIASVLQVGPTHQRRALGPVVVPRPRGRPLIVHAAPLQGSSQDIFGRAKAVLMIVDPDEHQEPVEPILRQAFGLTLAEARLASGLAAGRDLSEIAHSHGIETGTARTQLKAIFAKTGAHRQGELVALLGRFALPGHCRDGPPDKVVPGPAEAPQ
jgi:DNA-binding CsgD family transcriptional regulator